MHNAFFQTIKAMQGCMSLNNLLKGKGAHLPAVLLDDRFCQCNNLVSLLTSV